MSTFPYYQFVTSEEEIRAMLGTPSEVVKNKAITRIDNHCADFISKAPIAFISTSDRHGKCDVSPRGDEAGFVKVLNEKHLAIPERPGNKRCDSLLNILSNGNIGLIFLIPGLEETLRINGKASIIKDQEILQQMAVADKIPLLAIGVEVEECFIHCAKAFKRSQLWKTESWPDKVDFPKVHKVIADHVNLPSIDEQKVEELLKESYTKRLY